MKRALSSVLKAKERLQRTDEGRGGERKEGRVTVKVRPKRNGGRGGWGGRAQNKPRLKGILLLFVLFYLVMLLGFVVRLTSS